mmetsp:Transcript_35905/g.83744  ORF Transcript_35905/g.83744 Transcript_35905/m.83744 type:complete len:104 (-) Transcript_35905:1747-2058(-)
MPSASSSERSKVLMCLDGNRLDGLPIPHRPYQCSSIFFDTLICALVVLVHLVTVFLFSILTDHIVLSMVVVHVVFMTSSSCVQAVPCSLPNYFLLMHVLMNKK